MANERTYAAGNLSANVPVGQNPDGNFVPVQVDASGNLKTTASITLDSVTVSNEVEVKNDSGNPIPGKLTALPGLDIPAHDYIALSYTGTDVTGVTYKTGGSGGTTVATLTLGYTDGKLTSVTRS